MLEQRTEPQKRNRQTETQGSFTERLDVISEWSEAASGGEADSPLMRLKESQGSMMWWRDDVVAKTTQPQINNGQLRENSWWRTETIFS